MKLLKRLLDGAFHKVFGLTEGGVTLNAGRNPGSVAIEARLSPENARRVREGCDQAARGEFADMTAEESEHFLETGELPARVRLWVESYDWVEIYD